MARSSSPWRALRPVFLAGAAAVTWLTLSSTAATADTGTDSSSLLGGLTGSVSSLSQDFAATVSPVPPVPAGSTGGPAAEPGLLQPVVAPLSGLADNLIAAVPVVDQVVPAGTVIAVSAPLVEVADTVAAGVAQELTAPAAEALPVLEPVLQPVSDLLTGDAPLSVPLPEQPGDLQQPIEAVPTELPAAETPAPAGAPAAAEASEDVLQPATEADQDALALAAASSAAGGSLLEARGAAALAVTSVLHPDMSWLGDPVADEPLPAGPAPLPASAPAAPGSGTGSAGSSGGPSGATAWLSPFDLDFELPCAVLAGDISEHAPSPVSFDPGSSPD